MRFFRSVSILAFPRTSMSVPDIVERQEHILAESDSHKQWPSPANSWETVLIVLPEPFRFEAPKYSTPPRVPALGQTVITCQ